MSGAVDTLTGLGTGLAQASLEGVLWFGLIALLLRALPQLPAAWRATLWWAVSFKVVIGLVFALAWPAPLEVAVLPAAFSAPGSTTPGELSSSDAEAAGATAMVEGLHGEGSSLPAIGDVAPWTAEPATPPGGADPIRSAAGPPAVTAGSLRSLASWTVTALPFAVSIAWSGALLAGLAVAGFRYRRWQHLLRRSRPANDPALGARVADLARRFGVRPPAVRLSDEVSSPQLSGWGRGARILLPPTCLAGVEAASEPADEPAELDLILAHELAHLRRSDLAWGVVPALARALFFFHPLVRRAVDEYLVAREAACDAEALRRTGASPRRYGRLLLAWGAVRQPTPTMSNPLTAPLGGPHQLRRRLTMLLDDTRPARHLPWIAALLLLLAVVPLRLTAAAPGPDPSQQATYASTTSHDDDGERTTTHSSYSWSEDSDGKARVFLRGDGNSVSFSGSSRSWSRIEGLQRGDEALLWFEHGGQEYVVRDAELLDQVERAFAPVMELGAKQGSLGAEQGRLGAEQGELGAEQGELGAEQGRLGGKLGRLAAELAQAEMERARTSRQDGAAAARAERRAEEIRTEMDALEDEMRELGERQRALGRQQGELGGQQGELGERQAELGEQQREASEEAEAELDRIIEEALDSGKAEVVR